MKFNLLITIAMLLWLTSGTAATRDHASNANPDECGITAVCHCDHHNDAVQSQRCPKCGGSGKVTCYRCNGRGRVSCAGCSGKGYIIVVAGSGRSKCTQCNGGGTSKCGTCYGNGTLTCNKCHGRGNI